VVEVSVVVILLVQVISLQQQVVDLVVEEMEIVMELLLEEQVIHLLQTLHKEIQVEQVDKVQVVTDHMVEVVVQVQLVELDLLVLLVLVPWVFLMI
tara:strand:- start:16 stop:303 length:288 start_codon:yes stop_codon:yes gene_type:complete